LIDADDLDLEADPSEVSDPVTLKRCHHLRSNSR
jgi:hypothetical protein